MLNRCIIMGRLTYDPELRHTQAGKSVTSVTLAVDRDFKGKNGEKETDFIDVGAWGNSAEFLCSYFSKGRMAVAEGRLQFRDWTDKDGNKRRNAEIIVSNVYFGDRRETTKQEQNLNQLAEAVAGFAEIDPADGQLPF